MDVLPITPTLARLQYEIDTYGHDVVAAFQEYAQQQARILRRLPYLAARPEVVSDMAWFLMRGGD